MAGMICPECGASPEKQDSFCHGCGLKLDDRVSCNHCGFLLHKTWKCCPLCTTVRNDHPSVNQPFPDRQPLNPDSQPSTPADQRPFAPEPNSETGNRQPSQGGSTSANFTIGDMVKSEVTINTQQTTSNANDPHSSQTLPSSSQTAKIGDMVQSKVDLTVDNSQNIGQVYNINGQVIVGSPDAKAQEEYAVEILNILKEHGSHSLIQHQEKVVQLRKNYKISLSVATEIERRMMDTVRTLFSTAVFRLSFDGGKSVAENLSLSLDEVVEKLNRPPGYRIYPAVDIEHDGQWRNVWLISDIIKHQKLVMRCASNGQAFHRAKAHICPDCNRLFENRPGVITTTGKCRACSRKNPSDPAPKDIINLLDEKWIFLKPGDFNMGSAAEEKPRQQDEMLRPVKIAQPFAILSTPVTIHMYKNIMGESSKDGDPDFPVTGITWYESVEFCNRMSKKLGMTPCYEVEGKKVTWKRYNSGVRLLTEAEWEYACRAGSATNLPAGDIDKTADCAWFGRDSLTKVSQKKANAWLLYDMLGLVWEWLWDDYKSYPPDQSDNQTVTSRGIKKVCRGGCYSSEIHECRCANREFAVADLSEVADLSKENIGFRIAVTIPFG